jgi:hypothetical protein
VTDVVRRRLGAQLLCGPPGRSPEEVARRILAIQAQDPRGARLAIRARSEGLTAADVDRAFTRDRSLVVTWLNRGTLHLVHSEDYPWLLAVTAPRRSTWLATRFRQLAVSPEDAEKTVAIVVNALATEGPLGRRQLRQRIAAAGLPVEGQAFVHQVALASFRGLVVRGPMVRGQQAFVLARDWLGEPPAVDRERALAELARRYLAGHGPASDRDLAYWAGVPLTDARAGLRSIASELADGPDGLVDLAGRSYELEPLPPRLLGPFDPILHGWPDREPIAGEYLPRIVNGGLFRPTILVDGRVAGTWLGKPNAVELQPFRDLAPKQVAALESDGRDVVRFLG